MVSTRRPTWPQARSTSSRIPLPLGPPLEHQVVLPLIGRVLLDCGDARRVAGRAGSNRLKHPNYGRVATVLVADLDRPEKVEVSAAIALIIQQR
jgi:hypothetical protein